VTANGGGDALRRVSRVVPARARAAIDFETSGPKKIIDSFVERA